MFREYLVSQLGLGGNVVVAHTQSQLSSVSQLVRPESDWSPTLVSQSGNKQKGLVEC